MTRHVFARTLLVSPLIAVTLLVGIGPRTASPVLGATATTITFDDLAAGTSVSNQYHAQGVDFTGDILPTVDEVGSGLATPVPRLRTYHSVSRVNFSFPVCRGPLRTPPQRERPSWVFRQPGIARRHGHHDIDGARCRRHCDLTDTQTVTEGQGFHTLLSVSATSATIVSFRISGGDSDTDKLLGIDDLSFDNPNGVPPDFSLSPAMSLVNVNQGSSSTDAITINRFNGSHGAVKLSASSASRKA